MPLPPHELIKIQVKHILLDPLHPLELGLHAILQNNSTFCVWTPVVGSRLLLDPQGGVSGGRPCVTGDSCCTLLYAAHSSLWTVVPLLKCCCIIGSNVAADRSRTIVITPRAGDWLVSTMPKTHTS